MLSINKLYILEAKLYGKENVQERKKGLNEVYFQRVQVLLRKRSFSRWEKAVKVLRLGGYQGEKTAWDKVQRLKPAGHMKKGRIVGGELGSNVGSLCNSLKTCWFLS